MNQTRNAVLLDGYHIDVAYRTGIGYLQLASIVSAAQVTVVGYGHARAMPGSIAPDTIDGAVNPCHFNFAEPTARSALKN
jgi:hypothetical protein